MCVMGLNTSVTRGVGIVIIVGSRSSSSSSGGVVGDRNGCVQGSGITTHIERQSVIVWYLTMTNDGSIETIGYGRLRLRLGLGLLGWRQRIGVIAVSEWSSRVTHKSIGSGDEREEGTEEYKSYRKEG